MEGRRRARGPGARRRELWRLWACLLERGRTAQLAPPHRAPFPTGRALVYDSGMSDGKSTRLSIVEQSLSDILERLADLQPTESTVIKLRELRTKAFAYERTTKGWAVNPPSEAQRQAMLKLVLELNVAVMELSKVCSATNKMR